MTHRSSLPMMKVALAAFVLGATVLLPVAGGETSAVAQVAPDGSRSHLTQDVVDREPLSGGGWRVTIEATLDSNAICHTLLFQCVVEPELNPTDMTLESVQCLSPGWNQIQITLPVLGTVVDVCARFDHHRAGLDQRFRFVYRTAFDVGTFSETAKFFRFPEEYFFIRAQDTVTFDVAAQADVHTECPDTAAIGSSIACAVKVEAFSNIPTASVSFTPPPQFTGATLVPDAVPGDWDCTALTECDFLMGGSVTTLPIGTYAFTLTATVGAPTGNVDACAAAATAGTEISSDCDEVLVYDASTDTTVDIDKTTSVTEVDPGGALAYTITVTNTGARAATGLRVFETPPPLLLGATIRFVSGDGAWTCASGATLECTAPALPVGGVATFTAAGTVSASAPAGAPIVNEITAEIANDPFGPDYPARSGAVVTVRGASIAATPVAGTPHFTG